MRRRISSLLLLQEQEDITDICVRKGKGEEAETYIKTEMTTHFIGMGEERKFGCMCTCVTTLLSVYPYLESVTYQPMIVSKIDQAQIGPREKYNLIGRHEWSR